MAFSESTKREVGIFADVFYSGWTLHLRPHPPLHSPSPRPRHLRSSLRSLRHPRLSDQRNRSGSHAFPCACYRLTRSPEPTLILTPRVEQLFFFESICYPVIFAEACMGLGPYASAGG
jgi:hypothetical protein